MKVQSFIQKSLYCEASHLCEGADCFHDLIFYFAMTLAFKLLSGLYLGKSVEG